MMERVSYAIGLDMGSNFRRDSLKINLDYFVRGLVNGLNEKDSLMTKKEIDSTIAGFQEKLFKEQQAKQNKAQEDYNARGKKFQDTYLQFLENNKKQPGVKTTASGLQYKVIKQGTGPAPTEDDVVSVHFTAKLMDGTEFDNTYKRGNPVDLPVKAVVPGWAEALKLMKEGGKATFWIPPDLAYKAEGAPPTIPPYTVLVFDIELKEVKKGQGPKMMEGLQKRRAQ
jgi:FKBP-type peptidyl-prolyl cis-trans isomerase FklB